MSPVHNITQLLSPPAPDHNVAVRSGKSQNNIFISCCQTWSAGVSTTTLTRFMKPGVFRENSVTDFNWNDDGGFLRSAARNWLETRHTYFEGNTPTLLIATRLYSGNTHSCEKTTMNSWVMSARVVNDIQDKSESSWDDLSSFLIFLCQQSRIC